VTSGTGVVPPLLRYVVMPLFSPVPSCEAKACPKTIAALALVPFNVALSTVIHVSSSGAAEAEQAVDDTLVKISSRSPSIQKTEFPELYPGGWACTESIRNQVNKPKPTKLITRKILRIFMMLLHYITLVSNFHYFFVSLK
jgi:hypothetical protein